MSWAKLDDSILDNPKIVRAGPIGFALHVAAITYCARNLTDGFVPYGTARKLLATEWTEDADGRVRVQHLAMTSGMSGCDGDEVVEHIIALLCEVRLWHEVPHGYELNDYLVYNPSKDAVLAERAKKQAAGRAGGRRSVAVRRQSNGTAQPFRDPAPEASPEAHASESVQAGAEAPVEAAPEAEGQALPKPVPVPVVTTGLRPSVTLPPTPRRGERETGDQFAEYREYLAALREATGQPWREDGFSRTAYLARRSEGFSAADLIDAAHGVALEPWWMGRNDNGILRCDPTAVLKTSKLQVFIGLARGQMRPSGPRAGPAQFDAFAAALEAGQPAPLKLVEGGSA